MRFKTLFLAALFSCLIPAVHAQSITVGTFNLRYDNKNDTGNLWINRAPVVASLIRFHQFDILGTQEGLINQLEDLSRMLPEYTRYGIGRDDGKSKGEHAAIFFKTEKFKLLDKGDFWLSETPEKPGPGWDAQLNRICSWVQLQERSSGKRFYFFNVHYDHQGVQARQESSKLILGKIAAIAGRQPVIFTGDFNGDHESGWYKRIAESGQVKDVYTAVKLPYVNGGSFNGFGTTVTRTGIIDHIFISGFKATRYGILTDTYQGKYPSDHFPVLADVNF